MYEDQITQFYQNILGRAPDPGGLQGYTSAARGGRSLESIRSEISGSTEAVNYRAAQAAKQRERERQDLIRGFESQISTLQSSFQTQMQQQAQQFAEAQRQQQLRMEQFQQQALEAQTRQAAPKQTAQVAGPGSSMIIRPGASTRFSRPELQIKSMNI